jgi:hypothetical protein
MTQSIASRFGVAVAAIICGSLCAATASAQGTAFTYQGRLKTGGIPADGLFDFQFSLWDAAVAGSQKGGTLIFDGVGADPAPITVTSGLFTTLLDFGNQYPGSARFLQIDVRAHAVGGYTTLSPRQPLTPEPYTIATESLVLPLSQTGTTRLNAFEMINTGFGNGLHGVGDNGVVGDSNAGSGNGVLGTCNIGSAAYGVWGESSTGFGVVGTQTSNFNQGELGTLNEGVYGVATGQFVPARGVYGTNSYWGNYGELGTTSEGVYGWGNNNSIGVNGQTVAGTGVNGVGYNGVWGTSNSTDGNGVKGECHVGTNAYGVWGYSTSGWAGTFSGKAQVTGNFFAGAKFFRIDHPLDPENRILLHASIESNEMKNVYDGIATLDANGEAWVDLPDWFESLNTNFRYQLTTIGEPALVYIKQKISGNRFQIAGGNAGMEVSWQVTGVRQDAYAKANPMQVEVDKQGSERGQYLHPAAFGLPETRNVQYEKLQAADATAEPSAAQQ